MYRKTLAGLVGLAALTIAGCAKSEPAPKVANDSKTTAEASCPFHLDAEPAGVKSVKEVKQQAKDGDEIAVVGRIGGSAKPFTGRAAFTIVDQSFIPCNERKDDDCPTPWDYCCDPPDELAMGTVLVKFVDAGGKTLASDAKTLLNVKELDTVVVKGQARRDESGSISIVASGIFLKKK